MIRAHEFIWSLVFVLSVILFLLNALGGLSLNILIYVTLILVAAYELVGTEER